MTALEKFIDMVRIAEQSNQSEVRLSLKEARNYSAALTKLLIKYNEILEKSLEYKQKADEAEAIEVEMDGGDF